MGGADHHDHDYDDGRDDFAFVLRFIPNQQMDAAQHIRRAVPGRIIMIMIIMMIMIRHELVMWRIGNDDGFDVVKFHIKPSTVRVICDIYIYGHSYVISIAKGE